MSPTLYLKILIPVLAVAGIFFSGWQAHSWKTDAEHLKALEALEQAKLAYESRESEQARLLQATINNLRKTERRLHGEINQITSRPVYDNQCLDLDGLRIINEAAGLSDHTGGTFNQVRDSPTTVGD